MNEKNSSREARSGIGRVVDIESYSKEKLRKIARLCVIARLAPDNSSREEVLYETVKEIQIHFGHIKNYMKTHRNETPEMYDSLMAYLTQMDNTYSAAREAGDSADRELWEMI